MKSSNLGRSNPFFKDRIRVVKGLVEDEKIQQEVLRTGEVDTVISEPIGVMLLHERMVSQGVTKLYGLVSCVIEQVESFILARDLFLKPGGQMLPSAGHIFFCPFTDDALYNETDQKVGDLLTYGPCPT